MPRADNHDTTTPGRAPGVSKPIIHTITTKDRPTLLALGLALATVHADYSALDRAATAARDDLMLHATYAILTAQEEALEALITSMPATNLADAAIQLGVAVEFADRLHACVWDDASSQGELNEIHAALSRITLSVLPIVAAAGEGRRKRTMRDPNAPIAYTFEDACRVSGHGLTKLYALVGSGVLDARKAGRKTVIMAESLHNYLNSLPVASIKPQHRRAA